MDLDEKFRSETTLLTPIRVSELNVLPLNLDVHLSVSSDRFNGLVRGLEPLALALPTGSVTIFSQDTGEHLR